MAANHDSSTFHLRCGVRRGQLRKLPYAGRLDHRRVRSQRDRIHVDWNAHVADADALRILPLRAQPLLPEFDGLLWLPLSGFPEHCQHWRHGAQPRRRRLPDGFRAVRLVPPHYDLVGGSLQPQRIWFRADQRPRERGMRFVPHRRQLFLADRGDGLRELTVPFDNLAANQCAAARGDAKLVSNSKLFHLPHDGELDGGV